MESEGGRGQYYTGGWHARRDFATAMPILHSAGVVKTNNIGCVLRVSGLSQTTALDVSTYRGLIY